MVQFILTRTLGMVLTVAYMYRSKTQIINIIKQTFSATNTNLILKIIKKSFSPTEKLHMHHLSLICGQGRGSA